MNEIKDYIMMRALEVSTWRGVILFLTGIFGYSIDGGAVALYAQAVAHLIFTAFLICGIMGIALPDNLKIKE